MDFARVELSAEDQEFRDRLRNLLADVVTDEVIRRDRETGENFDEGVHLALGAQGYLADDFNDESDGGFGALRRRIWDLEIGRAHTPWFHWGTTAVVARMMRDFGPPELTEEVLPGVLSGEIRLCLGYTEPEGGSDVATCKTRAVREADGSSWVINGSKMFTSNAHNAQYVFLLTNTDPDGPKHQNLTMFLVPLKTPASTFSRSGPSTATAPTSSSTATCGSTTDTASARSTAAGACCGVRSTRSTAPPKKRTTGCNASR